MTTVLWWAVQDENRAALTTPVGRVSNQPSGLLLSPRFPTPRNAYQERCRPTHSSRVFLFWWAVQNENRNKQRQGIIVAIGILPFVLYGALGAIAAYVRTGSLYTSGKV